MVTAATTDRPEKDENLAPARGIVSAGRRACFHCGELCTDSRFEKDDKAFCCQGCLLVHDLLAESGLGHFYDLNQHPGTRVKPSVLSGQWAFLDEAPVRQRLLDFSDGRTGRVTFQIPSIHCVACVWLLENLFRLHPGIGQSQVNFARREAAITFDEEKIKLSELVALLASIGYEPTLTFGELDARKISPVRKRQWLQMGVAGFAFGNIMLFSLPQYFGYDSFSGPLFKTIFGWLNLLLTLPVILFSASDYWKSALFSLRQRALTLEVPIVLGMAAIYGRSIFEIVSGTGEGYCDSLTGLVFLLLCGRAFQHITQERLAFDRDYKSFFPLSVARLSRAGILPARADAIGANELRAMNRSPGRRDACPTLPAQFTAPTRDSTIAAAPHEPVFRTTEERISISQLQVGDRIVIRNSEIIPADSKLLSGPAFIDYSFVTGESEPVSKQDGDYLYAGGQQIGAAIELETVKPVSQSYLTSLWNHETFQKDAGANFNSLTNRYSRWFTLAVVGVALAAALFWIALGNSPRGVKAFASVLIVACPCALALAAPFALGTIQRWLARVNVFLKNALVLERMARVDTIVFDKTGTLTSAGINAVKFHGGNLSATEENWLFSLTRHSTHPHSVAISESFGGRYFPNRFVPFWKLPAAASRGRCDDHEIWLGSRAWLESRNVNVESASSFPAHGSVVHLAVDGRYRGAFVLSSELRSSADQLIRQLGKHYDLALLSGDNERERERFRALFGDDARLNFNQSPLDKLGFIRRLQESGKTVMMVGDGLNDAGALKQSDVGVAVVEKVGAFSPASDVILDAACVPQLADVLRLSRRGPCGSCKSASVFPPSTTLLASALQRLVFSRR